MDFRFRVEKGTMLAPEGPPEDSSIDARETSMRDAAEAAEGKSARIGHVRGGGRPHALRHMPGSAPAARSAGFQSNFPSCPQCCGPARPAILMFGDMSWRELQSQNQRYRVWKAAVKRAAAERVAAQGKQLRIVILEFGAGNNVPTVRRNSEAALEDFTRAGADAWLVRVNPDLPLGDTSRVAPGGDLEDRLLGIMARGLESIRRMHQALPEAVRGSVSLEDAGATPAPKPPRGDPLSVAKSAAGPEAARRASELIEEAAPEPSCVTGPQHPHDVSILKESSTAITVVLDSPCKNKVAARGMSAETRPEREAAREKEPSLVRSSPSRGARRDGNTKPGVHQRSRSTSTTATKDVKKHKGANKGKHQRSRSTSTTATKERSQSARSESSAAARARRKRRRSDSRRRRRRDSSSCSHSRGRRRGSRSRRRRVHSSDSRADSRRRDRRRGRGRRRPQRRSQRRRGDSHRRRCSRQRSTHRRKTRNRERSPSSPSSRSVSRRRRRR